MVNNINNYKKSQKGITLIALAITIIVLIILAGISIGTGLNLRKQAIKNKQLSELNMIEQSALEQYTKYNILKDENKIVGTEQTWEEVNNILNEINKKSNSNIELKVDNYDNKEDVSKIEKYYKLDATQLGKIGISNVEDGVYYIINYKTGEVINPVDKTTYDGEPLYVYAVK